MPELQIGGYKPPHKVDQLYCGKCKHWHKLRLSADDLALCECCDFKTKH